MIWIAVLALASVTFADYSQVSSDDSYGVVQQQAVQVQQYPVYGEPTYNLPAYANVRGGRNHGAFFDATIDNYKHRRDSDDSDEYGRPRKHRRHSRRGYGNYYAAAAWPFHGQQDLLSNPFYHAPKSYRRRSHRGRHHNRSDSSSGDRSD